MCYLYLRNVKGYGWNHKRIYRIYKRTILKYEDFHKQHIIREKPDKLVVPVVINDGWSMDLCTTNSVISALDQIIEWRGKPNRIREIHIQLAKQITEIVNNSCLTIEKPS